MLNKIKNIRKCVYCIKISVRVISCYNDDCTFNVAFFWINVRLQFKQSAAIFNLLYFCRFKEELKF